jgi:hypothetical protein
MVFNATFNNISVVSFNGGVLGETHRLAARIYVKQILS